MKKGKTQERTRTVGAKTRGKEPGGAGNAEARRKGGEDALAPEDAESSGQKPVLKIPFSESLSEDARRLPSVLIAVVMAGILLVLLMNLSYSPNRGEAGSFSSLKQVQGNYDRVVMPVGFLLAVEGGLAFLLGRSYGERTHLSFGNRHVRAREFFMKISFYIVLIGVAFILSGLIADYASGYP